VQGIWNDSIVTFFNDNGGNVWEGGRNYPYRGGKMSAFEGGSRATAFIKFPNNDAPDEIDSIAHISDIYPTVVNYVDRLNEVDVVLGKESWEEGLGYDLLSSDNVREDVLQHFDETTDKLGYRYKNWKIVGGNFGDMRRFGEPKSDSEWIGSGFHDVVSEFIMNFQHDFDEDASGSMDEMVREIFVEVAGWWTWSMNAAMNAVGGGEPTLKTLLYDLSVDPYEDNDISSENAEVVKMMEDRVKVITGKFGPQNCNWFVGDAKVEYRPVSYINEAGENVTKQYHAPWVEDGAYGVTYFPMPLSVGGVKKYGCFSIFLLEIVFILAIARKLVGSLVGGTSKRRSKKKMKKA